MSTRNCKSSSVAFAGKCTFAEDRLAILEHTMTHYAKMRSAALVAGATGRIDMHFIAEDVVVIDRKIKDAVVKMMMLRPCVRG